MKISTNLSLWSAIVSSSEDAIISKGLDGIITSWNPAAEAIFGYSEKEAIGNKITLIIPNYLIQEEAEILSRVKNGERINHLETVRKRKDGTLFPAAITISPIKNSRGIVIGASKIARDISEKKLLEEKQGLLSAIIESSDDAVISKNLDGIITSWNKSAETLFGYKAFEAIGRHISIIIPPNRLHEELMIIQKIKRGERLSHFETIRSAKNGKEMDISLTVSPIKTSGGVICGASKIVRNISETKEIERQKKLLTEQLLKLSEYKDEFMAMASHELRTPLTVVKTNLDVLGMVASTDEQRGFLNKAQNQLRKLSGLITDLLDGARIHAGQLDLDITEFNFIELVKETVENLQITAAVHHLQLNYSSPEIKIRADWQRIEQVLMNVLTNAIKYSPGKDRVNITILIENSQLITTVQDYGIGVPEEDIQNIFTRFYRVRGSASTFSGSGIGLYISEQIITRHGGKIWATSETGEGSVFRFTLPL